MQYLIKVLSDLDLHTWVLEPPLQPFKSSTRRLLISRYCSVSLDIDPEFPYRVQNIFLIFIATVQAHDCISLYLLVADVRVPVLRACGRSTEISNAFGATRLPLVSSQIHQQ